MTDRSLEPADVQADRTSPRSAAPEEPLAEVKRFAQRIFPEAWLDDDAREALDLVAESVAAMAGFEVAVINVLHDGLMKVAAVAGDESCRADLLGLCTPPEPILELAQRGEDWGRFRYVREDQQDGVLEEDWTWTPDIPEPTDEGDWSPLDMCLAPLFDADGSIIGVLSIDVPVDRRRPSLTAHDLLDRYAAQAERTVALALHRLQLSERVRLSDTAREIVRLATAQDDLTAVLGHCRAAIAAGFEADFAGIRTYEVLDQRIVDEGVAPVSNDVADLMPVLARRLWMTQRTIMVGKNPTSDLLTTDEQTVVSAGMDQIGMGLTLFVPLGSGPDCLGLLVIGRVDPTAVFNSQERGTALEVGRDIGQAVRHAAVRQREARVNDEMRTLSTYRSKLLSTVSHELKNPLGAIEGHIELLESAPELSDESRFSVNAMRRASTRSRRVIDDLLLLANAEDAAVSGDSVSVGTAITEAMEMMRFATDRRPVPVEVRLPEPDVMAAVSAHDLDRMVTNLITNALKYTPDDRPISVGAERRGDEVEITVADQGLGISDADQEQLFREFFRSTNPRALEQAGTGLGLTICKRVAERHGGRIEFESRLDVGSTFRLFLPVA